MGKLICLMLVTLSLTACQTGDGVTSKSNASGQRIDLSQASAAAIADDIAKGFAERNGPIHNAAVEFKGDHPVFEEALKVALGARGYAIASDDRSDAVSRIAYGIERLDGEVLVRLSAASLVVTRVYSIGVAGATPAGPYSLLTRM